MDLVKITCRWSKAYPNVCTGMGLPHRKSCESCLTLRRSWQSTKISPSRMRAYGQRLKREAFEAYGGAFCVCCGEDMFAFLSLDHVNNDGYVHGRSRKSVRYSVLKQKGYPKDPMLQVLCFNCNCGKKVNGGVCPHKTSHLN